MRNAFSISIFVNNRLEACDATNWFRRARSIFVSHLVSHTLELNSLDGIRCHCSGADADLGQLLR